MDNAQETSGDIPAKSSQPIPETPEELLVEVEKLGVALRALIVRCKLLEKTDNGLSPYQRPKRSLELAQEYLQTGMLWLRKCIMLDTRF